MASSPALFALLGLQAGTSSAFAALVYEAVIRSITVCVAVDPHVSRFLG